MSNSKILYAAMAAFKQKFITFCQNSEDMFDKLDDKSFHHMTSLLMDAACDAGKAGIEQFLIQTDTKSPTVITNGVSYRYKGTSPKELLTLFGTISTNRAMYYNEDQGGEYFYPLDNALGLDKDDFATLETREMILFASASNVPRELALLLEKCSLCRPSRTAIQNIINRDGTTMESMRDQLSQKVFEDHPIAPGTKALVASLDGVNLLLREQGKKKGRKAIRPTENVSRESPTSYHNAMVGAVSCYGVDSDNKPERLSSIYTARMPQEKSTNFKGNFELLLRTVEEKADAFSEDFIPKILLTDGHLMIKGFARDCMILHPYEKLLDFYHATEHLSKAADALYGEQSELSRAYYNKWRERLKTEDDAPGALLRSLKGFQLRLRLTGKRGDELKTEITFFRKNKNLMKYSNFIRRGLPIGSGPIEAAAKTIVRQRMCRSGMSWSREKGQYILTVRAYVQSGLWEKAWEHFKQLKKMA